MDYQRIYDVIIERARVRNNDGYVERHHIIPRCMGGGDEESNLVELTAKEHFLCHKLLVEMYPKEPKLVWGYWMMAKLKGRGQKRNYHVGAREYERLREAYSQVLKKRVPWNKGLTKEDPRVAKYTSTPRWNTGKTKSTDGRVAEKAAAQSGKLLGRKRPKHSTYMKALHEQRKNKK